MDAVVFGAVKQVGKKVDNLVINNLYNNFYKPMTSFASLSSDLIYSPTIQTTYTLVNRINKHKNIKIGPNAILQGLNTGLLTYLICDTLELDGIIKTALPTAVETNTYTDAANGAGAGNIIILTRKITGSGSIIANGGDATHATKCNSSSSGGTSTSPSSGYFLDKINGAGKSGTSSSTIPEGGSPALPTDNYEFLINSHWWLYPENYLDKMRIYSGAGGHSYNCGNSNGGAGGASGGSSVVSTGGSGTKFNNNSTLRNAGGAGGGGGGYIFVFTPNDIPSITLSANGGNGGNGYNGGGGAGGGAGGLITTYSAECNAIFSVTGGARATTSSTGYAENGKDGLCFSIEL